MEGLCVPLVFTLPVPPEMHRRLIRIQSQQQRSIKEISEKQLVAIKNRRCDSDLHAMRRKRMAPIHAARLRVETDDILGCPTDQDARIALCDHNRRRVRCLVVKGLPPFSSGFAVESDDTCSGRTADLDDQV